MKLLLDENISRRIVPLLQECYPNTTHIVLIGLEGASDKEVWQYAKDHDYIIVSKDEDFLSFFSVYGYPPKLIRLLMGNCSNTALVESLVKESISINKLINDKEIGLIELY